MAYFLTESAHRTLKRQARALDLPGVPELYDYIIDSIINGNRPQAAELFKELPKGGRIEFLKWVFREHPKHLEFFIDRI